MYYHFANYRGKFRGILIDRKHKISAVGNTQSMEVLLCLSHNIQVEYEDTRNTTIPHEINTRYIIKKELGKGAYGTVYLAVDRTNGQQ